MVSKEQRRNELARAKLARQQAKREADAAKRRRLAIIATAVSVLLVIGGVSFLSLRGDEGTDPAAAPSTSASASAEPTRTRTPRASRPATGECEYVPEGEATIVIPPPDGAATPLTSAEATIETTEGTLTLALDPATAPCTVQSFVSLAGQSYFDGTTCHRLTIREGLKVLQCGDPTGTGSGGPGYSFADETNKDMVYTRGTVAMANSGPDTNGSQFFLVYGDSQLPPSYTVFGQITAGLEVLDAIAAAGVAPDAPSPTDGAPAQPVGITTVTVATGG